MRRALLTGLALGTLCLASAAMAAEVTSPQPPGLVTTDTPAGATTVAPAMAAPPPMMGSGDGGKLGNNSGKDLPTGAVDNGSGDDLGKHNSHK
jgi:hypothetical protein